MIDLVVDGTPQYTLVSEAQEYDALTESLASRMATATGTTFTVVKAAKKDQVKAQQKISIGRELSRVTNNTSSLSYKGGVSLQIGKTIYLTGRNVNGINTAVDRFVEILLPEYKQQGENGKINFKVPDTKLFFTYNPNDYINPTPTVLGTDLSEFVIVLPEKTTATERLCLQYMLEDIGLKTGCVLKQTTDRTAKAANEIVLGETTRSESQALYHDNYLVMQDAYDAVYESVTGNSNEEIEIVEIPDYASQMLNKANENYVRVMTSNVICAADRNAVSRYDINGITPTIRMGIQGATIMDYLPDFVGFQEMQEGTGNGIYAEMHSDLLAAVESEYSYFKYPQIPIEDYMTPILYRHTVWQIEAQDVMTDGVFHTMMHRWQWALFSKIDQPNVKCIVMNVHYPISSEAERQLKASAIVNAKIKELQELYPNIPIFLTGDLNAKKEGATFGALVQGTSHVTANNIGNSIDHVIYDSSRVGLMGSMFIKNGYIAKTSDHRPFFGDFLF